MEAKLNELFKGVKRLGITGHVKPDGDCVGSTLGVYQYVRANFPEIEAEVFLECVPDVFLFLQGADAIITDYPERPPFDLFLVLDCGDEKRIGKAEPYFSAAKRTACIDHHVSNTNFAQWNYIMPDASSTCELVYDLSDRELINEPMAEALYTGIVHDTGVFQYSCTAQSTMEAAGVLMSKGIPYPRIISDTFFQKTYAENRLLGQALLKSRLHLDGQVISSILYAEDFRSVDATPKDTEGIVASLRNTKGTEASILLYQNNEGTFKLSLRSTESVDCAAICQRYGGGGHVRAAGATIESDPEKVRDEIVELMEGYIAYFNGQNMSPME